MNYRVALAALLCVSVSSCTMVRDFGCLTSDYWIAAASHAELGIYDTEQTAVMERNVRQVGLVGNDIVAECQERPGDNVVAQPGELPCTGFNIIDTRTGQVWRGLSEATARTVLRNAGLVMPRLRDASEWLTQDWPEGNPSVFCKSHPDARLPATISP